MDLDHLAAIANAMVADNKGLLAADESTGTIGKRLDSISVKSTEDTRRDYREMLFRADGLGEYIGGVILYDETIRQNAADGTSFTRILVEKGILPGIKVDTGAKALAGAEDEKVTEGLGRIAGPGRRCMSCSVQSSRNGELLLPLETLCRRCIASMPMRTPWRATPDLPGGRPGADSRT